MFVNSQELPTIPAGGFSFPIGTKFTIKLTAIDSVNFNYSIIAFEPYQNTVDTRKYDELFDKKGMDSTISFYFCYGTHGETEKEKEENLQIVLFMKNYTKMMLNYTSEIQRKEDGEYEPTSNVGTFPGAVGSELWPYMIYSIALRDFRLYKY